MELSVNDARQMVIKYVDLINRQLVKSRLDVAVVVSGLQEPNHANRYKLAADQLVSIVSSEFDLDKKAFLSRSRVGPRPEARYMWVKVFKDSFPELSDRTISNFIDRDDHSFVIYACRKWEDFHVTDRDWREKDARVRKRWSEATSLVTFSRKIQLRNEIDFLEAQLALSDVGSPFWKEQRDLYQSKVEEYQQIIDNEQIEMGEAES